eukprot:scaffold107009_cov28-Phaeocystis_antarctica.AAC.1
MRIDARKLKELISNETPHRRKNALPMRAGVPRNNGTCSRDRWATPCTHAAHAALTLRSRAAGPAARDECEPQLVQLAQAIVPVQGVRGGEPIRGGSPAHALPPCAGAGPWREGAW